MNRSILMWSAELKRNSKGIADVVDRLDEAINRLDSTVQGFGSPWGTTLLGTLIGELYNEVHEMAMDALESNAEVMSEYAEALDSMADEVEDSTDGRVKDLQDAIDDIFTLAGPQ
jgi:uncharacterized protein YukE